jgi:hypothetical protein
VLPHCGQVFWGAGLDNEAWGVWGERVDRPYKI